MQRLEEEIKEGAGRENGRRLEMHRGKRMKKGQRP